MVTTSRAHSLASGVKALKSLEHFTSQIACQILLESLQGLLNKLLLTYDTHFFLMIKKSCKNVENLPKFKKS